MASEEDGLSLLTPKKDTGTLVTADIWHASWRRYSVSGAICNWVDCHTVGESPSGSLVISLTAPIDASYLFCPLIIFLYVPSSQVCGSVAASDATSMRARWRMASSVMLMTERLMREEPNGRSSVAS